jgi:glycine oxidase
VRVFVVGAGVIGCAVAFECARRGARVHVFDPRGPGRSATFASAGILAPYIEGHSRELRALAVHGLEVYEPFLDALAGVVGQSPEYRRCGTLQAAFDDEGARELNELARLLDDLGVEHRRIDGTDARRVEPALSARVIAAMEIPSHAYVSVEALVGALVDAATRYGATFSVARVRDLRQDGSPVQVGTDDGTVEADAVVLATGSWVSSLLAADGRATAEPAVRPIRGQLLRLKSCVPAAARVLWGPGCYVVPRLDGTVLVGATVEDVGFDENATVAGVRTLVDAAVALAPGLDAATFDEVRVGLRPATADELPIIGPSATMPQVFYAGGHYRSGVLLAPLTAGLVADLVLEGRAASELDAMRPARFGL